MDRKPRRGPTAHIDRRSFLKGVGALSALSILRGATPALAGVLSGPKGTRQYPLVSLAKVQADSASVQILAKSFDLTEHGHDGWFDVVLWPGDRERLSRNGFRYDILVEDLIAQDVRDRQAEMAAAKGQAADDTPAQRFYYRFLFEYEADLKALADANPLLVRHFELPYATHEGRKVKAVEIGGPDVRKATLDGRPASLIMGLHHAREWPSAELTMMLAQDLVDEYNKGTAEIVELLNAIRFYVIPVVNPDGYVRSRETVSDFLAPAPGAAALAGEFAYHRKNMRKNSTALVEVGQGVDPNRNYPYHWGGPGASSSAGDTTYFGPGPGSEPEIKNVLSILRNHQVLTLITNHTYGNLVLRPWGDTTKKTPDETQQKALGDAMAAVNGFTSQKGIQLYATTGTAEDWLYGACGGYGYTFEIGANGATGLGNTHPAEGAGFHPQYNLHIPAFYEKNRGAFLLLLQAARNEAYHTVLKGKAPPGARLFLRKTAVIDLGTDHNGQQQLTEELGSSILVGPSGTFVWHVNPSPLPATLDQIKEGDRPESDRETYRVEAEFSNGTKITNEIVALRGRTYDLDFTFDENGS